MSNEEQMDRRDLLQNALRTIDRLQARIKAVEQARNEPIAIIGLGCRFPGGADDPESFWNLLYQGVDTVTEVPPDRWDVEAFYDPNPDAPGKSYNRWGAFLDQVDEFDPQFFGIAPREATSMDPQQRLLLEVSWEALENAGYAPARLAGTRTGVFTGLTTQDHAYQVVKSGGMKGIDAYFGSGMAHSMGSGRVSYLLGLQGPSVVVDTACSSSLTSTHLACQSLRAGECDMALAGGANLVLTPDGAIIGARARMVTFEGHCKTFDASADGYVRGEGGAMIVLKRLSDALASNDHILGLILGTALNHDGRSQGLTAPNGLAQEAVIRAALANGGVQPRDVSYIEAHGTGTSLGDPIEVRALGAVFGQSHSKEDPLWVGSVKTNVGHLEAAAGIVGLIKVVLAFQHKTIPPHLHFHTPNPRIPWDKIPVKIPIEPTPWPAHRGGRRIAGVSSFGFSGTNAHLVLAEPPAAEPGPGSVVERSHHVLSLSAKTGAALEQLAGRFEQFLARQPDVSLADVCYTANTGRSHLDERAALVVDSLDDARQKLAGLADGRVEAGVSRGTVLDPEPPEVAFLFTGQGSQYVGMGRTLYETEPVFRAALDQCDDLLRRHLERPLLSVIYAADAETAALINETAYTQPALFALEYALAQLWRSWGIEPGAVMGHSVGEYVAACVAGVFGLEDGLKLIAERGRLMQALPAGGTMAAVLASEERVTRAVAPWARQVSIAAINGPENVVISGAAEAVQAILDELAAEGIKARPLTVSHAFHSPLMEPMLDAFAATAASIRFGAPQVGLISNVSGQLARNEITTPAYWRQHVRAPVRFADAMQTLHQQGTRLFLEIGPAPVLLGMGQRCVPGGQHVWLPSLRPNRDDWQQMLGSLATLYVQGLNVAWEGLDRERPRRRVVLPTYPFQRQSYRMNLPQDAPRARRTGAPGIEGSHPLLERQIRSSLIEMTLFESHLGIDWPSFLTDHRFYQVALFPATGYVEMALAAASQAFGAGPHSLEAVAIHEALVLPEEGERTVQVMVSPADGETASFRILSLNQDGDLSAAPGETWKLHTTGRIRIGRRESAAPEPVTLDQVRDRCPDEIATEDYYRRATGLGVEYGPSFQGLVQIRRRDYEALGWLQLPKSLELEARDYQVHPALLDAGIQLLGAALPGAQTEEADARVFVPVGIEGYRVHQPGQAQVWCHARLQTKGDAGDTLAGELDLFDQAGRMVAQVWGLSLKQVTRESIQQMSLKQLDDWLYQIEWKPQPWSPALASSAAPSPGRWLILADAGGVGAALAQRLEAQGDSCLLVRPLEAGAPSETAGRRIDPVNAAAFQELVQEIMSSQDRPPRGIVNLWGLDGHASFALGARDLNQAQRLGCASALHLVQALLAATAGSKTTTPTADVPRLWLVTRAAQPAGDLGETRPVAAQATLWGLGRTIALEHPGLWGGLVDLDPVGSADEADDLLRTILARDGQDQVAFRHHERFAPRLVRSTARRGSAPERILDGQPFRLDSAGRGILDNLEFRPQTRRAPGPGEVEIKISATGIGFRDVLNALGMYPGDARFFGSECAGEIVALGQGVDRFAIGDQVVAFAPDCYSSYVTVQADFVAAKPRHLTLAEAATIPTAFLTAYYTLHHLAGMSAGDRVLIHAAAGGVGMAAVQLAQAAGAEIYATAGSPEKRALLKSLGVPHVMDSRSLDFADQIMALTGGQGVDMVLNSLSDDFIAKSVSVLADKGRFLEIGKRGIWEPAQMAAVRPDVAYYPLDPAAWNNPSLVRSLFEELMPAFETGNLKPLPLQVFAMSQVVDAFRFMAQAKHIGKLVVIQEWAAGEGRPAAIRDEGTYLITGGLGGLGLTIARWLVERGARHLVLMGRSAPTPSAREVVDELEKAGASVMVAQADVADAGELEPVVSQIEQSMPPLRGIIHAAGVLDDGVLSQQDWQRFVRVLKPKVEGSWNLHHLTRHLPLDFFILFSSVASVTGSPGQGNYAAANAYLDSLSYFRRAQGLPALTINWGPWSEVGMAARTEAAERGARPRVSTISPQQGVRVLERLVGQDMAQDMAQVAVMPVDWQQWQRVNPALKSSPLFADQVRHEPGSMPEAASRGLTRHALLAAQPETRQDLLTSFLCEQVSRVLGLTISTLDARKPLTNLGLDSLMALELKNRIETDVGVALPAADLLQGPTVAQLATLLVDRLAEVVTPAGAVPPEVTPGVVPGLDQLSTDQLGAENAAQLLANLDQLADSDIDSLLNALQTEQENDA